MSRAEHATIALYESADLRGELIDEDAERLLQWASDEIVRIDAHAADDSAFEDEIAALHRVVKGVNRVIGKRADLTADEMSAALDKIADSSAAIGRPLTREGLAMVGGGALTARAANIEETLHGQALADAVAFAAGAASEHAPSDSDLLDTLMAWVGGVTNTPTVILGRSPFAPQSGAASPARVVGESLPSADTPPPADEPIDL
jgi:hypothetical protein